MKHIAFTFTLLAVCALCAHGATTYPAIRGDTEYEHIAGVRFGSIDNSSGADPDGYDDCTSQSTAVLAGSSATITLTPGFAGRSYSEGWCVWIDLNDDGDFTDSDEQVYTSPSTPSSAVSGTITIPAGTPPTTTRMRVVMKWKLVPESSIGSIGGGEAEDYTILIGGGDTTPPAAPTGLSATPGNGSVSLNWGNDGEPDLDSYSAEVPLTPQSQGGSLVVHWALDNAYPSGSDLMTADNSGHGNNGKLLNIPDGGAVFRPGLDGNCLELAGTDDGVQRLNVVSLTLGDNSAWSMNLYVKVDRQPKNWTRIANLGEAQQRQLFIYKDAEVAFLYEAEGLMLMGKKLIPGNWHMLTVCYDPPLSQLRLYFDGVEAAIETLPFEFIFQ